MPKAKVVWEELYTDLGSHVANILREARIKPEKLPTMSDDELMALPGLSAEGLEEIRSKFAADLSAEAGAKEDEEKAEETESEAPVGPRPANKRHDFRHGKAIKAALAKVDRTKNYPVSEAVKLVQDTTIAKFDATITLHLNLENGKDKVTRAELTFPHLAGTAKRVVIASDDVIKAIDAGKIDFDILITTPAFMPKLAKFAKVLGPKGLMPNPKNGTVTADPESKKKEFEAGKTVIKAEPKFPLMHITVGKVKQPTEEIVANVQAVLDAVKPKNITKAVLASSMSPGVKVQVG